MKGNYFLVLILTALLGKIAPIKAQSSTVVEADKLFQLGDYTNAIKKYENVTPNTNYTFLQIARAHKAIGTYDDALNFYSKAIDIDSESTIALFEYGKLLITKKKFVKADSIFGGLIYKYPKNPNFQYQLGLVKEIRKDSTAINYYQNAFNLDNSHQKSCYKISKHFLSLRAYDSVVKYANTGLSYYNNNVELISILGQNYYKKEHFDKAIPYFLKLLKLNFKNEFIYRMLATSYHKEYEYQEALKYYGILLNYDDKNPKLYYTIAELYSQTKNYAEAQKYYHIAITLLDYSLDKEYHNLAMNYRHQEKWKEAITFMKKSLKENPESLRSQYQLAVFADAYYKDPKTKLSYYTKYMEKFGEKENTSVKNQKRTFKSFFEEKVKKRITQLKKEIESTKIESNSN